MALSHKRGVREEMEAATNKKSVNNTSDNKEVKAKLLELYDEIFTHSGYGEIKVNMRILPRGQKEVIIHCGKEYRFVVNYNRVPAEGKDRK